MYPERGSDLQQFAEEIGLFFEENGLPRMQGRILGWLLVCDPPEQSAEDLAEALSASRGSISMAIRMLQDNKAVERRTVPGSRRAYYRLRPGFWLQEADTKARLARSWLRLTERGLGLMTDHRPERTERLREAREMYAFLEQEYAAIAERWRRRRAEGDQPTASQQ